MSSKSELLVITRDDESSRSKKDQPSISSTEVMDQMVQTMEKLKKIPFFFYRFDNLCLLYRVFIDKLYLKKDFSKRKKEKRNIVSFIPSVSVNVELFNKETKKWQQHITSTDVDDVIATIYTKHGHQIPKGNFKSITHLSTNHFGIDKYDWQKLSDLLPPFYSKKHNIFETIENSDEEIKPTEPAAKEAKTVDAISAEDEEFLID